MTRATARFYAYLLLLAGVVYLAMPGPVWPDLVTPYDGYVKVAIAFFILGMGVGRWLVTGRFGAGDHEHDAQGATPAEENG